MPNYVMNVVTIKGNESQIERAYAVCCDMDFNKMIPMPETLNVTSGSTTSQALGAYVASIIGSDTTKWTNDDVKQFTEIVRVAGSRENLEDMVNSSEKYLSWYAIEGEVDVEHPYGKESDDISYLWATSTYNYKDKEPKNRADAVAFGRVLYENIKKYGYPTWYDWCCDNWGTKWNASDVDVEKDVDWIEYQFTTAWGAPTGIMDYLAETLVDLEISWNFADEDLGCNCALLVKKAGSTEYETIDEENLSVACAVWGYDEDEIRAEYEEEEEYDEEDD